ncbi:hypothetical protein AYR66_12055 [Noviherbaspirillum denitrificans]|uniref:Uncharacterized protein n=1 Tax=Noviherbaspirillum denitrificans TaxID=1968433 RepID=A0A254TD76_9BURK|nr:hypothetical protein AYR66_12055 [Noviherbaspirillum denitrificans]
MLLAFRRFDAKDQHVLGQPALVAAHRGRDTQREALLAQQRIAAVAGAVGPDFAGFRIMDDVLGFIARPRDILLTRTQRLADGVHAGHELAFGAQHVVHGLAHAGHDAHVDGDVRGIGQLDADVGDRGTQRAHGERHHVHGAAAHAAVEQPVQGGAHFSGRHPVVGRAGVFLFRGADEGAVFDARHVGRVGAGQVAVRALGIVQLLHGAGGNHLCAQPIVFFLRAVAPVDALGLGQRGDFRDPVDQLLVLDVSWCIQSCNASHNGLVHKNYLQCQKKKPV